jgi:hypothetical protein
MHMHCPLKIDNNQGLIFSSSITPISGTVNMETKLGSYEILVSDKNSNEILRKSFRSDALETPFTWDLKSELDSIVESGCYIISLIGASKEIECSIECKVADTRNILSITRSLKHRAFAPDIQALSSIYFDIIGDIQATILERLKDSRFEEPYFVACITAGFIQEIADDIEKHPSRILALMNEFQSKNPMPINTELGLRALFDFLINYMADTEDQLRANAMARCGHCNLTQNDRAQIVSSLVSAIYPHCKTISFPKNIIGGVAEKIVGGIIRLGIRYVSAKHVNRSISICQTLPLWNPCDAVIL